MARQPKYRFFAAGQGGDFFGWVRAKKGDPRRLSDGFKGIRVPLKELKIRRK